MRWADLDLLGHVNNVVFVDYLQEARVDMLRTHGPSASTGDLAEGVVVARHEVNYLQPLLFEFRPVSIESWVTEIRAATFTVAYEVFHDLPDGGRRVYLRASTVLTPFVFAEERPRRLTATERDSLATFLDDRPAAPDAGVDADPSAASGPATRARLGLERPEQALHYPVRVRFSDVDVYGHVNNVKYFEYFQEARLAGFAELWDGLDIPPVVVARTDVEYRAPILLRPEVYDAWSWVSRVGRSSTTIDAVICDGDRPLARAQVVVVFIDPQTQRSAAPPEAYLDRLRTVAL